MFSNKDIKKILNDQDVIAGEGKESLRQIHTYALELLDLSYNREDLVATGGGCASKLGAGGWWSEWLVV